MPKFKLLYVAPVFALIALLAWALASPIGSSPDDDFHLDSIWCANSANTDNCLPGNTADERKVPAAIAYVTCYARQPDVTAACLDAHTGTAPTVLTKRGNFSSNYPPVYYATMSIFAGPDVELSVLAMRLFNILLLLGFVVGLALLLPRNRRTTLVTAWLISTVPLGLFLIASNNPSSWAIIGLGSGWIALLGFFESTGRRRVLLGTLYVLAVVMAAGARADAAMYSVLSAVIVGVLTFQRTRRFLLSAILPAAMVLVALAFFFGSQQAGVAANGLSDPSQNDYSIPTFALVAKDLVNVPSLWVGSFGTWGLGWVDTEMPYLVPFATLLAFIVVVAVALRHRFHRKTLALLVIAAILVFLPVWVLVRGGNQVGQNVQPRYLLPLIILGAGIALLTAAHERLVLSRTVLLVAGVSLAIAEPLALYFDMRRFMLGAKSTEFDLDVGQWWWHQVPVPPMVVLAIGSLAFLALLFTLVREAMVRSESD